MAHWLDIPLVENEPMDRIIMRADNMCVYVHRDGKIFVTEDYERFFEAECTDIDITTAMARKSQVSIVKRKRHVTNAKIQKTPSNILKLSNYKKR